VSETELILLAAAIAAACLLVVWNLTIGKLRGTLAWLCRIIWVFPALACLFPETLTQSLPRTFATKTVHVLLDDSVSMTEEKNNEPSALTRGTTLLNTLKSGCDRLGCQLRVSNLSDESSLVRDGYTPLSLVMEPWLYRVGKDPWILVSDGGDYQPAVPWDRRLAGLGKSSADKVTGLIADVGSPDSENIWIEQFNVPPFSFEGKPLNVDVVIRRQSLDLSPQNIQLQLNGESGTLTTVNSTFTKDITEISVSVTVPPFKRGHQLIGAKILPSAKEKALWDNEATAILEVMPNTVGVLHLLGSPSWDGRFLRRYFKSEPKYDLISFFILRDPWDSQQVNERELSLIPFPVQRLFNEELPNFRVIIVQNFTMVQFLQPEYQENLVKFVKNGGGLLIVGGPRAFQMQDLQNSPLREILPFEVKESSGAAQPLPLPPTIEGESPIVDHVGPSYDAAMKFKIELADPDAQKRSLANVYEDWQDLSNALRNQPPLQGVHRMDRVNFKADSTTPLLNAVTTDGKKFPLAVASYPAAGRAIWLFTDQTWKMGLDGTNPSAHQNYVKFYHSAMTWLLRQDLKQPIIISDFHISKKTGQNFRWQAQVQGPAARFIELGEKWQVNICGKAAAPNQTRMERLGPESWKLSGEIESTIVAGDRCRMQIEGQNPAFGSVKTHSSTIVPRLFLDREIGSSQNKLRLLGELTEAKTILETAKLEQATEDWLAQAIGSDGVALPPRYKSIRNFYWPFEKWWIWLCLLFLPLEVLIRRWHRIFGVKHSTKEPQSAANRSAAGDGPVV
jgi:hypothetical protein